MLGGQREIWSFHLCNLFAFTVIPNPYSTNITSSKCWSKIYSYSIPKSPWFISLSSSFIYNVQWPISNIGGIATCRGRVIMSNSWLWKHADTRWWFQTFFLFTCIYLYLGTWSNLIQIFPTDHQDQSVVCPQSPPRISDALRVRILDSRMVHIDRQQKCCILHDGVDPQTPKPPQTAHTCEARGRKKKVTKAKRCKKLYP